MRLAMRISPSRVEQLDRAHLAHVHAHRIGGAAELGIERGQRRGGFLDGLVVGRRAGLARQQRLGVRCLFVHRNAHVVDRVDDAFDLLGIDDLGRQVIVDLRVGQIALLLAARDQQLELRLAVFGQAVAAPRLGRSAAGGAAAGARLVRRSRSCRVRRASSVGVGAWRRARVSLCLGRLGATSVCGSADCAAAPQARRAHVCGACGGGSGSRHARASGFAGGRGWLWAACVSWCLLKWFQDSSFRRQNSPSVAGRRKAW